MSAPVGVIGAGAWGTALAQMLASDGSEVLIWAREPELVEEINTSRTNSLFLPSAQLFDTIEATSELADLARLPALLAVVPAQFLASVLSELPDTARDLVLCAKGIEASTGRMTHEMARDAAPSAELAVLSGPTFAHEVAAGLPTAVTLACSGGGEQWRRISPLIARPRSDFTSLAKLASPIASACIEVPTARARVAPSISAGSTAMRNSALIRPAPSARARSASTNPAISAAMTFARSSAV